MDADERKDNQEEKTETERLRALLYATRAELVRSVAATHEALHYLAHCGAIPAYVGTMIRNGQEFVGRHEDDAGFEAFFAWLLEVDPMSQGDYEQLVKVWFR